MRKSNYIDESILLLERPNIRKECNINSDEEMNNFLIVYNVYNDLLIQFLMKKYYLVDFDKELEKHKEMFPEVTSNMKDLYQTSSEGYLKYFYLRNNIYIERLSKDEIDYLYNIYKNGNVILDDNNRKFIENTYLKLILEDSNANNVSINYGPDNKKYMRPCDAIIIGVRYDQFKNLQEDDDVFSSFSNAEGKLQILTNFLEYKVKQESNVPFYVMKYDDFSVKKKINLNKVR